MRHIFMLAGVCIVCIGCNGGGSDDPKDAEAIFEAVIHAEAKHVPNGEAFYVSIEHKDPEPEFLKQLQKQLPKLEPASKRPKQGKVNGVSASDLKWINRNTAELRGGFSNGMDGHGNRYKVVRTNGAWVIQSVKLEIQS